MEEKWKRLEKEAEMPVGKRLVEATDHGGSFSGNGEQEEEFATFFAFASSTIEPAGDMPGETGLVMWLRGDGSGSGTQAPNPEIP